VCPGGVGPESPRDRMSFPDTLGYLSPESAVAGPNSGNSDEGWRLLGTEADANISLTMGIIAAPAYVSMGSPVSCFLISELYGRWDAEIPSAESSLGSFGEGAGLACSGTEGRVGPENPGGRMPFPDTLGNLSPESAPFGPKSRDTGEGWGFSGTGEGGGTVPVVGLHAAPEPVSSASPECCSTVSGLYGKWEVSFSPLAPLLGECEGEVGLLFSGTKAGTVSKRISLGRVAGHVSTGESCDVWSRGIPICPCNTGPHRPGLVSAPGREMGGASVRIPDKVFLAGDGMGVPSEFCPKAGGSVRAGGAWPVL